MKKIFRILAAIFVVVMLLMTMCSCQKVKDTVKGWLGKAKEIDKNGDGASGQQVLGEQDGATNRQSRIDGALAKARNSQMAYNSNRALDSGLEAQPDGTVYVVEANGFYVVFTVQGGELLDTNPEVLPTSDPYAKNKDYKKETKYVDNIRKDTTIYLPKGSN